VTILTPPDEISVPVPLDSIARTLPATFGPTVPCPGRHYPPVTAGANERRPRRRSAPIPLSVAPMWP